MGVVSIYLGIINSFVCLFVASVLGLIFSYVTISKNKEGIIPFGPFILISTLLVIYFSEFINNFISNILL